MFGSLFILAAERGVWRQFKQLANAHRLTAPKGGKNSQKSEPHTGSFLSEVCFAFGVFFRGWGGGLTADLGLRPQLLWSRSLCAEVHRYCLWASYVHMKPVSVFGVFLRPGCWEEEKHRRPPRNKQETCVAITVLDYLDDDLRESRLRRAFVIVLRPLLASAAKLNPSCPSWLTLCILCIY